ncbi:hypothetical protein SpCBS45565_g04813 [Spizellomyces sp. 'palustris']|nr:hypothetical protein SpCBS45565_g04813 [Spizellomyces sp. 'palustris']
MDYQAAQARFEQACTEMTHSATREAGTKVMLEFRSTQNVLPLCKHIFETTQRDDVRFHVVTAIKEVAAREYALHPKAEIHGLRDWLLEYVVGKYELLPPYVRNSTLSTVAVIVKRGWLEESGPDKEAFFGRILGLLNGEITHRQTGVSLLSYMLDEFSSDRSSAVGLPYDFHIKSRRSFEEGELRHIFRILVQIIQHTLQAGPKIDNPPEFDFFTMSVAAMEKILGWDFVKPCDNALQGRFERRQHIRDYLITADFPISWREFIVRPDIIDMFFQLHHTMEEHDRLSDHTRQCLIHLAGLHGSVFCSANANGLLVEDQDGQRGYVAHFLKAFLKPLSRFLSTTTFDPDSGYGPELIGITSMAKRVLQNFPLTVTGAVPEFLPFLNELGKLTVTCSRNTVGDSEEFCTEAADELLDLWAGLSKDRTQVADSESSFRSVSCISLVRQIEDYMHEQTALRTTGATPGLTFDLATLMTFLTSVAYHVFDTYVDSRLELAKLSVEDEVDNMKDEYLYEDQLLAVALIGRVEPGKSIAKLQQLITDRMARLHEAFAGNQEQASQIPILLEHIHWLSLLSGHLLADSGRGEKPEIPRTLRGLSLHSGIDADPVVTLAMTLFKFLKLVSVEPDSPQFALCSPLVSETLLWFVERWTETYLFLDSREAASPSLVRAFGRQQGGEHVLDFILTMVQKTFVLWHGETDVLIQVVNLLNAFSRNTEVRNALLVSETFQGMISFFLDNLSRLPADVHSPLIENIATIATHATSADVRSRYFTGLSNAIEKRLLGILNHPQFLQIYQLPENIESVMSTMEMYGGLALAADESNTKEIFATISKYFDAFIKLLEVYRNVTEVEKYILLVFANLIRCQSFEELTPADCQKLYAAVFELLKTYAKNEVGKTRVLQAEREEELYEDVSCILELLAQLMASQYEGLAWSDILVKRKNKATVDVADVIFYGVNVVIPLITDQMLQFPELCKDYISLVSNLVRYFPDKLSCLPSELLSSLVRSLEFGMHNAISEVARSAFEAVTALALFGWDEQANSGISPEFLHPYLDRLLQQTLEMFLFRDFDSGLMESAGEALFGLALSRGDQYNTLTQHLISQQSQPHFARRLSDALQTLNTAIAETAQTPGAAERLRIARVEGFIGGPSAAWFSRYRERLEAFLMDVRGFLRVK